MDIWCCTFARSEYANKKSECDSADCVQTKAKQVNDMEKAAN